MRVRGARGIASEGSRDVPEGCAEIIDVLNDRSLYCFGERSVVLVDEEFKHPIWSEGLILQIDRRPS